MLSRQDYKRLTSYRAALYTALGSSNRVTLPRFPPFLPWHPPDWAYEHWKPYRVHDQGVGGNDDQADGLLQQDHLQASAAGLFVVPLSLQRGHCRTVPPGTADLTLLPTSIVSCFVYYCTVGLIEKKSGFSVSFSREMRDNTVIATVLSCVRRFQHAPTRSNALQICRNKSKGRAKYWQCLPVWCCTLAVSEPPAWQCFTSFFAKLDPASGGATKPIPHPASTPTPAGEGPPLEAAR